MNAADYENMGQAELIEMLTSMDSGIKAAHDRLIELSKDEEFMRLYHLREKVLKEGQKEEKSEIARNAQAEGATPEFVQKITGLDPQAIGKPR